jgi:catechol 2,3-dioxygenase-like lactoylglutathione lyase family enzyme
MTINVCRPRAECPVNILFVASVSAIVRDVSAARGFYTDGLGLSFEGGEGDYVFTEQLGGVKHFGLWPLHDAAVACFGTEEWPTDVPVPQASIEFEVSDVATAAQELEGRGNRLIHGAKTEPWTQVIARLLSPDGLLIGVCYTPWFHERGAAVPADG